MIPYDDLVVALANWRAKQGLGAPQAAAPQAAVPAAAAKSGSGPKTAAPGSGPTKAPPKSAPQPAAVVMSEPAIDVDDAALLDEDYALDNLVANDEPTSIGSAPGARDSFGGQTSPDPQLPNPKGSIRPPGNRNDDW